MITRIKRCLPDDAMREPIQSPPTQFKWDSYDRQWLQGSPFVAFRLGQLALGPGCQANRNIALGRPVCSQCLGALLRERHVPKRADTGVTLVVLLLFFTIMYVQQSPFPCKLGSLIHGIHGTPCCSPSGDQAWVFLSHMNQFPWCQREVLGTGAKVLSLHGGLRPSRGTSLRFRIPQ